jgi:hypothetical protein
MNEGKGEMAAVEKVDEGARKGGGGSGRGRREEERNRKTREHIQNEAAHPCMISLSIWHTRRWLGL